MTNQKRKHALDVYAKQLYDEQLSQLPLRDKCDLIERLGYLCRPGSAGSGQGAMKNILIGAAIVLALLTTAHADTFRYRCMFHGKKYPLQVDDTSMFLLWRGRQFGLNTVKDPDVCGKGGWRAEGNGTAFNFCYATKGGGGISDEEGYEIASCRLVHR